MDVVKSTSTKNDIFQLTVFIMISGSDRFKSGNYISYLETMYIYNE